MKKTLSLGIIAITATFIPIAAIASCGNKEDPKQELKSTKNPIVKITKQNPQDLMKQDVSKMSKKQLKQVEQQIKLEIKKANTIIKPIKNNNPTTQDVKVRNELAKLLLKQQKIEDRLKVVK